MGSELTLEDINPGERRLETLKLDAEILDFNPNLPEDQLCRMVNSVVPSREWLTDNILLSSQFPEKTKKLIYSYIDGGYRYTNNNLRLGAYPELNSTIDRLPPIDRDIIVLRYSGRSSKIPDRGIIQLLGYLSTSLNYAKYLNTRFDARRLSFFRIKVPAGQKALYVPGPESELLFKSGNFLRVDNHYTKHFDNQDLDWYEMTMLPEVRAYNLDQALELLDRGVFVTHEPVLYPSRNDGLTQILLYDRDDNIGLVSVNYDPLNQTIAYDE